MLLSLVKLGIISIVFSNLITIIIIIITIDLLNAKNANFLPFCAFFVHTKTTNTSHSSPKRGGGVSRSLIGNFVLKAQRPPPLHIRSKFALS